MIELLPTFVISIITLIFGVIIGRWSSSLTDWFGWGCWAVREVKKRRDEAQE